MRTIIKWVLKCIVRFKYLVNIYLVQSKEPKNFKVNNLRYKNKLAEVL